MKTRRPGLVAVVMVAACDIVPRAAGARSTRSRSNSARARSSRPKSSAPRSSRPYEYYYASEHLDKAMSEAAEGDYATRTTSPTSPKSTPTKRSSFRRRPTAGPGDETIATRGSVSRRDRSRARVARRCARCGQGAVMRGKIAGLDKLANQAERNGAMRCAPRELALAKSHLKFAEVELDQGFLSQARAITSHRRAERARRLRALAARKVRRARLRDAAPHARRSRHRRRRHPRLDATCASSSPRTRTATSTTTAAPSSTTTSTASSTPQRQVPERSRRSRRLRRRRRLPRSRQRQGHGPRPRGSVPERAWPAGGDKPGLPAQAGARRRHRQGNQDHAADPLRVRQGHDPAGELPDPRRRRRRPAARTRTCASKSRATPTTRARAAYNLKLSDRRAASVEKYLVTHGYRRDRLVSHGYGLDAADRSQRYRAKPCAEPARPIHPHRRGPGYYPAVIRVLCRAGRGCREESFTWIVVFDARLPAPTLFAFLGFISPAIAAPKDAAAIKLADDAINNDYLATNFAEAEKKLRKAIAMCGASACSAQSARAAASQLGRRVGRRAESPR